MPIKKFLIVDSHEDLAWNMLTFGRDYTQTVQHIRNQEAKTDIHRLNGSTLLGWDAYQRGKVGVVFATLFNAPIRKKEGEWDILCYKDDAQAQMLYQRQLDAYHRLVDEHPGHFRLIRTKTELADHLHEWQHVPDFDQIELSPQPEDQPQVHHPPVGLVLLMEGAEGIRHVEELPEWWAGGVRMIGPAWIGTRFCGGTEEPGRLTEEGFLLLEVMADLGFVLDLSHMDEQAVMQALDTYSGPMIASHANPLALLPGEESNRFLPDQVLEGILARNGVVGIVPYNRFLDSNWRKGMRRQLVSIQQVAAHIDYVCQMAGNAEHVGIGSDFDGGFGWQHVPEEIDTIADLQKLAPLLAEKGYTDDDLTAIFGGNWLNMLQSALPEDA
jgi:membrane dipeptidase